MNSISDLKALKPKTIIFGLYDGVLAIVDFMVSRTSDSLADIMIKALPLVAPIPNAVSIYFISQSTLNYTPLQAFAVAAGLECMFFALTEVTLKLWDGSQSDRRYKVPLIVAGILFGVFFLLVMTLVAVLEVPHNSYAPLAFPVVSVVAALTLGCERWHRRNVQTKSNQEAEQTNQLKQSLAELQTQIELVQNELGRKTAQAELLQTELNELRAKSDDSSPMLALERANAELRAKLIKLLSVVSDNRITGAADVVKLTGINKGTVYPLWNTAEVAGLVYLNGDGAYHVAPGVELN